MKHLWGSKWLLIVCVVLVGCVTHTSRPIPWQLSHASVVLNKKLALTLPSGWIYGEYVNNAGVLRPRRDNYGDVQWSTQLIAATKETWTLQNFVWRVIDKELATTIYGAAPCDCADVDCHQQAWLRYYQSRYDQTNRQLQAAETVALKNITSIRLTWQLNSNEKKRTQDDYLFCEGQDLYQLTYSAPSGFFYHRFQSEVEKSLNTMDILSE